MEDAQALRHAHELIDRMPPSKVGSAVVMLEKLLDPVVYSLANAPFEDEAIGEEEESAAVSSREWFAAHTGQGFSMDEMLAEVSQSSEELKRRA